MENKNYDPGEPVAWRASAEMIEAACRKQHGARRWNATLRNPGMAAWVTSHREHMRDILQTAFAAAPASPRALDVEEVDRVFNKLIEEIAACRQHEIKHELREYLLKKTREAAAAIAKLGNK